MLPKFPLIKKKRVFCWCWWVSVRSLHKGVHVHTNTILPYLLLLFICFHCQRAHALARGRERERQRKRKNHPLNGAWSSCNPFFLHFLISSELQSSMFMLPALFSRHQDQDLDYMGSSFLCTAFNHCYGANITPSLGIREAANSLWTSEK